MLFYRLPQAFVYIAFVSCKVFFIRTDGSGGFYRYALIDEPHALLTIEHFSRFLLLRKDVCLLLVMLVQREPAKPEERRFAFVLYYALTLGERARLF